MRRLISLAAALSCVLAVAAPSFAQTADEVVAKNLQAKGGAEKWKSISSVKMTGTVKAQGMEAPMVAYTKRPNLSRQDITTPAGPFVQAYDGTTPWMMPPGADAPREVKGPQAEGVRRNSDFDGPLIDYAAKGHKLELVGKEKLGTGDVHHLKVMKKEGDVEHYYFDAESGLEVKRTVEIQTAGGVKQTLETQMSDYKPVDGLMIPHTMTQSVNGNQVAQVTIEKVEINGAIDDALFRMPLKAK
jgi:outer membrane lipoprotein-sorting protein